jgi:hypothetical protein
MRVRLAAACVVISAWTVVHAQTTPPTAKTAALSGMFDLESFVTAYLLGFIASTLWLSLRAWRGLRAEVKTLRARS